ncbi:MAG: SLAP domain-containing protein [Lactobacillus iners]|nr:SLAP domain-containing protein [Lactobacillus iners]
MKAKLAKKVTPAPEPVKPTPVVPTPEPKPEETTYHFTYKGADTTVSTDHVAGSAEKAEQYFRAYASESGLNLDFTYDEATHTFVGTDAKKVTPAPEPVVPAPEPKPEETTYHFQYDDKKGNSIRQDFATTDADTAEMHFIAYASDNGLSIDLAHFAYDEATHTFVYKDFESEKGEPEVLPVPAVDVLAEAKKVAHEEFTKAGITGKIFHDAIDAAKTVEGLQAYVAETLKAHKTVEPVTPTPAPVVSGETGIGYLNLDMLSDGFTGTLYVPVVGKDVNCKVRLLDDAGKYTNDYVVTDTTVKALASKVVNGVTFYKVAENRWIPAKFAEVLSDKEVAFKGVAKTFVKGHANYAVAMLDANGKYTGKFLKQGSSFKVFAKKVINGHLCYRLGTQAQWVPARFLVF